MSDPATRPLERFALSARKQKSGPLEPPEDDRLEVGVIGGRLVISIGVRTLAFAANEHPQNHRCHEDEPARIRVTDALAAAQEVVAELSKEEEDGTTLVHLLLDRAIEAAWENGGEGFAYDDDDDAAALTEPRAADAAVWREHVPVTGTMHDPANGLLHGYCVRCRTPWPCEWSPESRMSKEKA